MATTKKSTKTPKKDDSPQLLNRTLPNRVESERALLGCIISDQEFALKVVSKLTEDDFYTSSHQYIIAAMRLIAESNRNIDVATVLDKLELLEQLELAGGADYIVGLGDMWTPSSQYQVYYDTVKRCSQLRKLIKTCGKIIDKACVAENDESTIAEAEQAILDISDKNKIGDITKIGESAFDVMAKFDEAHRNKGKIIGISTGIWGIDSRTNGFKPGNLVVLAAGTGVGKSSMAMNIVEYAAKMGKKCAVFSLEMSKTEIAQRLACSLAAVSMKKAQEGALNEDEWIRINKAINIIAKLPVYVDDSSAITAAEIAARCRRLKSRDGLDLVVIDYLQLMSPADSVKEESRQQQVSQMTRSLKIMAKELELPVLALSQFSREAAKRKEKEKREPILADLRESGAIEQDSDIVFFLYRPDDQDSVADAVQDVEVIVAKNRNGPIGKTQIKWLAEIVRFVNNAEEAEAIRKQTLGIRTERKEKTREIPDEATPPPEDAPEETEEGSLPY